MRGRWTMVGVFLLLAGCSDDSKVKPDETDAGGDATVQLSAEASFVTHELNMVAPPPLKSVQKVFVTPAVEAGSFEMGLAFTGLDTTSPSLEVGSVDSVDPKTKLKAHWVPDESPWKFKTTMQCKQVAGSGKLSCEEPADASFTFQYRTNGMDPPMMPLLLERVKLQLEVTDQGATGTIDGVLTYEVSSKILLDVNDDGKFDPADDLPLTFFLGKPNEDTDGDGTLDDFRFTANVVAKPAELLIGTPPDAGTPDAETPDAGTPDAESPDAAPDLAVDAAPDLAVDAAADLANDSTDAANAG